MTVRVYVSVGSNVERKRHIRSCISALREHFGDLTVSTVYQTEPVGFVGNDFYNLVVGFDTGLDVQAVAARLRQIEDAHGRRRDVPKFSARTLDLDLLVYGDLVLREGGVQVPRDEITRYAFVLCPLAEVAGDEHHPVLGVSFGELWQRFALPGQRPRPVSFEF